MPTPDLLRPLLRPRCRARLLAAALALLSAVAAPGAQAQVSRAETLPMRIELGAERITLPADEGLGLVGATLLFDGGSGWWLGPAVYGAASGRRGGLFVGGVELRHDFALGDATRLSAGLFAGGGGGAAAPVGGGLMLRPALTLWQRIGALDAGLSLSQVRFPSGEIRSSQVGLVLGWTGGFRHFPLARVGDPVTGPSGLGFDRLALGPMRYRLQGAAGGRDDGRRVGLLSMRAERDVAAVPGLAWGFEAGAAARGDAAGYMEILGSLAWRSPPWREAAGLRVGARAALGLGGGGGMPTGGGLMAKAGGLVSLSLAPGWSAGAELGWLRGVDSPLRGRFAQLWLATALESTADEPATAGAVRTEWIAAIQHHARASRGDGTTRSLQAIGLKLNRYLGAHLYLTAQAHSAFAGGAGAYSIGLLGVGLATGADPAQRWRAGLEVLGGAAGGAGVLTGGGAIVQALGWVGLASSAAHEWRLGAGYVRSRSGALSSPIVELGWSRRFTIGGP